MYVVVVGAHVAISSSDVTLRHIRKSHANEHLTSQSKREKIEVTLVWDVWDYFTEKT